jgi:hypothetical protein
MPNCLHNKYELRTLIVLKVFSVYLSAYDGPEFLRGVYLETGHWFCDLLLNDEPCMTHYWKLECKYCDCFVAGTIQNGTRGQHVVIQMLLL